MKKASKPGNIPKKRSAAYSGSGTSDGDVAAPASKKKRPTRKGSKSNRERHRERSSKRFISHVGKLRRNDIVARRGRMSPKVNALYMRLRKDMSEFDSAGMSQWAVRFYDHHGVRNKFLRVSADGEPNISNPDGVKGGGRGVFATREIWEFETLCPYVSHVRERACDPSLECEYCLRIDKHTFLCSREAKYDSGYLMMAERREVKMQHAGVNMDEPCPENFGRYVNTLLPGQPDEGRFNAEFEASPDGLPAVYLKATRKILEGEEILAPYGNLYFGPPSPPPNPHITETGTVCSSDDEDLDDYWRPGKLSK